MSAWGRALGASARVWVPVTVAVAAAQTLLVVGDPVPVVSPGFVVLTLASGAAFAIGLWFVSRALTLAIAGEPVRWRSVLTAHPALIWAIVVVVLLVLLGLLSPYLTVVGLWVDNLGDQKHDVILDIAGTRPIDELRGVLAPRGTVVFVGGEGGGPMLNGMQRQIGAGLFGPRGQKFVTLMGTTNTADLMTLSQYLEAGTVIPAVEQRYPLEQAADAIRYIGHGHATGKTVITVSE